LFTGALKTINKMSEKKLKVWATPECHGKYTMIISAYTKKEAVELAGAGWTYHSFSEYWSETGNTRQLEVGNIASGLYHLYDDKTFKKIK